MVDEARHTLLRWREQGRIDARYAEQWEQLLDRPIPEIRRTLVSEDQTSDDLRQNSPFAGMLSEPERRRTLDELCHGFRRCSWRGCGVGGRGGG
jgi:hypothetical protein